MSRRRAQDPSNIYRTTRCLSAGGNGRNRGAYPGRFPGGFIRWIQEMGWWGSERVYLCSGPVEDEHAIRVDVRPEVNPTHCEDARKTSLPSESADFVLIDPPYTKELAERLYDTKKHYAGINAFVKEAARIVRPGGLILTLTYEIPKRPKDCEFIAVCGVYTVPMTGYMRCLTVSRKQENKSKQLDLMTQTEE